MKVCDMCDKEFESISPIALRCSKECKKVAKKIYDDALRCETEFSDNANKEVRLNNIFILGQLNTCNTELVKLSLS